MLSSNNILSPAHGRPLATPSQDMVIGGYYLTYCNRDLTTLTAEELDPRPRRYGSEEEIVLALEAKQVGLQDPIEYRRHGEIVLSTPGRVIFNEEVSRSLERALGEEYDPGSFEFMNRTLGKKEMGDFISGLVDDYGAAATAHLLDTVKELGFHWATQAGITISKNDIVIPANKEEILAEYEQRVDRIETQFERGLITEAERHESIVNIWTEATDTVADAMEKTLFELNPVYMMANSGARGSFKQIRQLAGMRGLMANPKGEIIERPIKANFMEGLSVLEYFISTHGARKGLADTALRTADSGYLTRRLVDVSKDVIIREYDCGTDDHVVLPLVTPDGVNRSLAGRVLAEDITAPPAKKGGRREKLAEKGTVLSNPMLIDVAERLGDAAGETTVGVRSVLKCRSEFGVCQACYGTFLATGNMCEIGDAVGPGDALHEGSRAPADLLRLKGATPTELYLVNEVQKVYRSQGVDIHDKHIELIVRQMLKKVRVENPGDTDLLPGQLVDKVVLERENARVAEGKKKGEQATFEPLILGITKASLATESFLSAASFQETTKVLTDASIEGKVDRLLGLKENVIIGKLIPAATGLKRYRTIEIGPSEKVPLEAYARPETEEQLLAALEEIGSDGDTELALGAFGMDFGGQPELGGEAEPREAGEAEETPEVDSPLDGE